MPVLRSAVFALICGLLLAPLANATEGASAPRKGLLWRLEREGIAPSYLFGTMHVSDPRVSPPAPLVRDAFESSRLLIVEAAGGGPEDPRWRDFAYLPRGRTLAQILPADLYERAMRAAVGHGLRRSLAVTMQAWHLALLLGLDPAELQRRAGRPSLDNWFLWHADQRGKATAGLESTAEVLAPLAGLAPTLQATMLARAAAAAPNARMWSEQGIALYLDRDIASLLQVARASNLGLPRELRRVLFDSIFIRNHRMVERMAPLLAEGGAFVAVGALHLAGEEGLIVLLRDQGWTVTRAD